MDPQLYATASKIILDTSIQLILDYFGDEPFNSIIFEDDDYITEIRKTSSPQNNVDSYFENFHVYFTTTILNIKINAEFDLEWDNNIIHSTLNLPSRIHTLSGTHYRKQIHFTKFTQ